jgi:hypothetical protein
MEGTGEVCVAADTDVVGAKELEDEEQ